MILSCRTFHQKRVIKPILFSKMRIKWSKFMRNPLKNKFIPKATIPASKERKEKKKMLKYLQKDFVKSVRLTSLTEPNTVTSVKLVSQSLTIIVFGSDGLAYNADEYEKHHDLPPNTYTKEYGAFLIITLTSIGSLIFVISLLF